MLGTGQVELEHDAMGVLCKRAAFSSDKRAHSFAARTMANLDGMPQTDQEITVDRLVTLRYVEQDVASGFTHHGSSLSCPAS
jgi:hypothetical protein